MAAKALGLGQRESPTRALPIEAVKKPEGKRKMHERSLTNKVIRSAPSLHCAALVSGLEPQATFDALFRTCTNQSYSPKAIRPHTVGG